MSLPLNFIFTRHFNFSCYTYIWYSGIPGSINKSVSFIVKATQSARIFTLFLFPFLNAIEIAAALIPPHLMVQKRDDECARLGSVNMESMHSHETKYKKNINIASGKVFNVAQA